LIGWKNAISYRGIDMPEELQAFESIIAAAGVFLVTYSFQIIGAIIMVKCEYPAE
jgi:hypothetical protein